MIVQLSETYEIVTPESAEEGDAADRGFKREGEIVTVREAITALRACSELSTWPIRTPAECVRVWASTEGAIDYRSGDSETRSIHLAREDGSALSGRAMFRMLRAARLIQGRI